MMTDTQVFECLCSKDPRNPLWADIYGDQDAEDIPLPRDNCFCDNCVYGRDRLALEIIKIRQNTCESTYQFTPKVDRDGPKSGS